MRTRNRILLTSLDIDLIWRPTVPSSTRMTTRYVPSRYKITKPTLVLPQLQHWLPRETTCWLQEYGVILIHWGWFGNTKSLYFNYCFWVDYQSSKFLYSCFAGDCSSEGGFEVCMHIFFKVYQVSRFPIRWNVWTRLRCTFAHWIFLTAAAAAAATEIVMLSRRPVRRK